MTSLTPAITATSHLTPPSRGHDNAGYRIPDVALKLLANRAKRLRIVLHSDDRIAGTPLDATFDLGNLAGSLRLRENLDAGTKVHYEAHVSAFALESLSAVTMLEVRGTQGWPLQSESFDSRTGSTTDLLCIVSGSTSVYLEHATGQKFALSAPPTGRVQISMVTRDAATAAALAQEVTDGTLRWNMVIDIEPLQSLA